MLQRLQHPAYLCQEKRSIVKSIQANGARTDGVGLQGHFNTDELPSTSRPVSALAFFVALGVDVAYTELDVGTPASNPDYAQQAVDFANVVRASKQVSRCVGITTWAFTDESTYVNG